MYTKNLHDTSMFGDKYSLEMRWVAYPSEIHAGCIEIVRSSMHSVAARGHRCGRPALTPRSGPWHGCARVDFALG